MDAWKTNVCDEYLTPAQAAKICVVCTDKVGPFSKMSQAIEREEDGAETARWTMLSCAT